MWKRKIGLFLLFVIYFLSTSNSDVLAATGGKILKVNNTALEFGQIVYIDSNNGDDKTGTGESNTPFKTIEKAFDYMYENCREGGAIVLEDGTYDVSSLFDIYPTYNLKLKYNKIKVSLIAKTLGKVTIDNYGEWNMVESSRDSRFKVSMYGIIFKTPLQAHTYYLGCDDFQNEYYNCVFPSSYGATNFWDENASIRVENCLFIGRATINNDMPANGIIVNSASTDTNLDLVCRKVENTLFNVSFDKNYSITSAGWENTGEGKNPDGSKANIGVYGGPFSWGGKVSEVKNILKVVLEVDEELQLSVSNSLYKNQDMIWNSSNEDAATVDNKGVVKALNEGNTIITVKSLDGLYTDIIRVLVVNNAYDYRLAIDLTEGSTCRLTIDDYTNTERIIWSSINKNIATVSDKGVVTAVSRGLTMVSAINESGDVVGQIYIRVRE